MSAYYELDDGATDETRKPDEERDDGRDEERDEQNETPTSTRKAGGSPSSGSPTRLLCLVLRPRSGYRAVFPYLPLS